MTVPVARASTARAVPIAVDAGATSVLDAEHLLHSLETLLGPASCATTHFASGRIVVVGVWPSVGAVSLADQVAQVGHPNAAVVSASSVEPVETIGPSSHVDSAATALAAHVDRSSGRLVRFAGREQIERETTVGEVLRLSEVDAVVALCGVPVPDRTPLDLREWARPELRLGRAVLTVQVTSAGLVPFESKAQRALLRNVLTATQQRTSRRR